MLRTPSTRKTSTVRSSLAILLIVLVGGRIEAADGGGTLRLATCQFPVSADVKDNGNWVRTQMRQASDQGADLIHFPECALSGYAGVDLPSIDDLDWEALHRETEAVLRWPVSWGSGSCWGAPTASAATTGRTTASTSSAPRAPSSTATTSGSAPPGT